MSDHAPGSKPWWIETATLTAGGIALAIWLWDGPIFIVLPATALATQQPQTIGDLLDAGCLTQDHLQAIRDGIAVQVNCPAAPAGPPTDRLFP